MFAIDDPSAVAVMPTPEAAGTPGFWTEGNPGLGQAATRVRASFLNGLQQELLNILGAASVTPSKTAYDQLLTAILKIAGGSSRVRGLVGANNSGTPNTQFDFACGAVDMRNPTTGAVFSVTNPASKTCNILTAGPAANGRDQAGAFTASSWVHFYYIYNPTTGATDTIASASASAPAALPAGYTAWAYACSVYLNASSQLLSVLARGACVTYAAQQAVVTNGNATTSTAVNVAALVPPNALEFRLGTTQIAITAQGSGAYSITLVIEAINGQPMQQSGIQGVGGASSVPGVSGSPAFVPNIGQSFRYYLTSISGTGPACSLTVNAYKIPNGGE